MLIATPAMANEVPFDNWLAQFKQDALAKGVSQPILDKAFAETRPIDQIIKLDRKQPESTKTLPEYLAGAISQTRISTGRRLLLENMELLTEIERKYGVDKEAIVALWGIETNYGENTGNFSVVDALATLAYDGRRSDYFRGELMNALLIQEHGHISNDEMSGSWAGAMGQCQFMPTSYLKYAVDYDGDGRKDIWSTEADVFASIANYLHSEGWKLEGDVAMPLELPRNFNLALTDIKTVRPASEWNALGVTYNDGSALVDSGEPGSVILVGKEVDTVPYIVYNNYKVILKWNRSRYFATAVDMLAEEIRIQ